MDFNLWFKELFYIYKMSLTEKLSSKLQESLNEVIQAIQDGKISLKDIVAVILPVKPKITKEERKLKKSEAYSRWYEKNKEYHKIWREKRNIKKKLDVNKDVFTKDVHVHDKDADAISSAFEDGNVKYFKD